MVPTIARRFVLALLATAPLLALSTLAITQADDGSTEMASASPTTALTFSGSLNETVSGSDTNACVFEDGDLRGQLAGVSSGSILSFDVPNAAVGTYSVGAAGSPKLSLVTLSDDPDEFLINWYAKAGTLTVSSLDMQVPVGDGSVSTKGASGSIEADIAADKHGTVHISGAWACHMPF